MYFYNPFVRWKKEPTGFDFSKVYHKYAVISDYYKMKKINGVVYYKITMKGIWKLNELRLNNNTHNFMVYLLGHGPKFISKNQLSNGIIRE